MSLSLDIEEIAARLKSADLRCETCHLCSPSERCLLFRASDAIKALQDLRDELQEQALKNIRKIAELEATVKMLEKVVSIYDEGHEDTST